ncbi:MULTISPECIES: hypothetical protein [unclassified Polynucleobacter]|uniref:hypothetical protein n=1 Tax=unclassified Polynucleobacter TaxID=2640945 RepID=UPI0008BFEBBB|nr:MULTISPECIES: hypothetical protein [unclassified Polynucleobacter]OHC10338.1 MAG: hypothetical protein A2X74_00370 [Polynucleobacter sp. GWA2_45_21]HBK44166.1 hypothetical protein [Polynucleobacter sp.]
MKKQDKSHEKNLLDTSNGKNSSLNTSLIQDKLDGALSEAIELYKNSADRLGVEVDVDKCKSSLRDSDNWVILKKAYDSPEKRQLLGAYVSAREALHSLSRRVEKAKILGGDMNQADVSHLLDSFRLLGVASYCIFDEHLQGDFSEIEKRGIEKGFDARKIAEEFLPKVDGYSAPPYSDIATRNGWIRVMIAIVSNDEIIRIWNQKNPDYPITKNTIQNAIRGTEKIKKNSPAQSIQSKMIGRMVHMGGKSKK